MKKILTHPLFIIFLILLVVFGLSWIGAGMLGFRADEDGDHQLVFSAVVTGLVGIFCIGVWIHSRWDDWKLTKGILTGGDKAKDDTPAELRTSFETALGDLETRLPRGNLLEPSGIHRLPWVIILGPPGAGKTTTLDRSGLRFTQLGRRVSGVGGTKNCVWWLSEDAVVLDTAGRYSTLEESAKEWGAFLRLLRTHRRRRPVDAVILEISITEVADRSPEAIEDLAVRLRDRLEELQVKLGVRFPVYLVFSHVDHIDGFSPFFAQLPPAERRAPWGFSLDVDLLGSTRLSDVFKQGFDGLVAGLVDRSTGVAAELGDRATRDAALCFPSELGRHRDTLADLTDVLFEGRRGGPERPWLTSVFFISPTQEGGGMAGIRARASALVGARPPAATMPEGSAGSYFVRGLFERVLQEAQNAARPTRQAQKRQRILQIAAMALLAPVVMLGSYSLAGTYRAESAWLKSMGSAALAMLTATPLKARPELVSREELVREVGLETTLLRVLNDHEPGALTASAQALAETLLYQRIDGQLVAPLNEAWVDRLEEGRSWDPDAGRADENDRFAHGWLALKANHILRRAECEGARTSDLRRFLTDYTSGLWREEVNRAGDPSIYELGKVEGQLRDLLTAWARGFLEQPTRMPSLMAPGTLADDAKRNLRQRAPGDEIVFHLIIAGAGLAGKRAQLTGTYLADKGIQLAFTHGGAPIFFDRAEEGAEWWQCILDITQPPATIDKETTFLNNGKVAWNTWIGEVTYQGDMDSLDGLVRVMGALSRESSSELDEVFSLMGGHEAPENEDPSVWWDVVKAAPKPQRINILAGCAQRIGEAAGKVEIPKCPTCDALAASFQPYTDAVAGPEEGKERAKAYLTYKQALADLQSALADIAVSTTREEKALEFVLGAMQDRESPMRRVGEARRTLVEALSQGRDGVDAAAVDTLLAKLENRALELTLPLATRRLKNAWQVDIRNNPKWPDRARMPGESEYCEALVGFVQGPVAQFVDDQVKPLLINGDLNRCEPSDYPRGSGNSIPISANWCRQVRKNLGIAAYARCPGAPPGAPPPPEPRGFDPDPQRLKRAPPQPVNPASCTYEIQRYILETPEGTWDCDVSTGRCNEREGSRFTRLLVQTNGKNDKPDIYPGQYKTFEALAASGVINQRAHTVELVVRKNACSGGFRLTLPFNGGDPPEPGPAAEKGDDSWKGISLTATIVN